jgi:hypothetical protein
MNNVIENSIDWRYVNEICGGDKSDMVGIDYEKFIEEMRKSIDIEDDDSWFRYLGDEYWE